MKTDAELRRKANKQGYSLKKSRRGYSGDNRGGYMILSLDTNTVIAGEHYDMSPEDVEKFLDEE